MTKLLLTRHGHVVGISPERFRGRIALPLTDIGESQAQALAARIAITWQPAKVYTSPMGRCMRTAEVISESCGIVSSIVDDLNDFDYGEWQGRSHEEVRGEQPDTFATWKAMPHLARIPGGESLQDVAARAANALRFILASSAGNNETIIVVGHDSVNRVLLLQLLDLPLSAYWRITQSPCALSEIDIEEGSIRALRINETFHLDEFGTLP